MAAELTSAQQLWLPKQDLHKIKTTNIPAVMGEGCGDTTLS